MDAPDAAITSLVQLFEERETRFAVWARVTRHQRGAHRATEAAAGQLLAAPPQERRRRRPDDARCRREKGGPRDPAPRADARRFESWECSVANRLGLGAAVDYARAVGLEAIEDRVSALAASLRERLVSVPGLVLRDLGERQCGIVTFTIGGCDPYDLASYLRADSINISVSSIDFARLDFESRGLDRVARASVHYYNTDEELDRAVDALARASAGLKSGS